jgi:2,3-bisphosphoglycerate-dependent phosphoglycerate mutase
MYTNIYFVRHAHSTYTPDELNRPLSVKGFKDVNLVTKLLQNEQIDVVYASPYRRAIQTVQGIADYIGKEITYEERFKERKLAEKPVADFETGIKQVWENPNFCFKGGESNKAAQGRGVKALIHLLEEQQSKNIVVGTHGNIMVLMMNYFDKTYGLEFWKELQMPDIYQLSFDGTTLLAIKRIWNEHP